MRVSWISEAVFAAYCACEVDDTSVPLKEAFLNEIVLFSILKQLGKMPQT